MSESKRKVLVLGSKPGAALPNLAFERVYTANAAAILAAPYRSHFASRLTAIVIGDQTIVERVREHVIASDPDTLLFRKPAYDSEPYEKALVNAEITTLSERENFDYQKAVFGVHVYRGLQIYSWAKALRRFIRHLTGRELISGCSTGLFAIIYALRENPEADVIFSGIGFESGGHFYGEGRFRNSASLKDILMIRHLPKSWYQRLYCTDEKVARRFGLQLWEGSELVETGTNP